MEFDDIEKVVIEVDVFLVIKNGEVVFDDDGYGGCDYDGQSEQNEDVGVNDVENLFDDSVYCFLVEIFIEDELVGIKGFQVNLVQCLFEMVCQVENMNFLQFVIQ